MKNRQITALLLSTVMTISACIPTGIQAYAAENAEAGATAEVVEMTAPEEASGEENTAQIAEDDAEQKAEEEAADKEQAESAVSESPAEESSAEEREEAKTESSDSSGETAETGQAESGQEDVSAQEEAEETSPVTEQPAAQEKTVTEKDADSEEPASSPDFDAAEDAEEETTDEIVEAEEVTKAAAAGSTAADFDNAVPLTVGGSVDVEVTEETPCAYYAFTPEETGTYRFYSTGSDDTYVTLYNSSFSIINSDDDGGDDRNFSLSQSLFAGNTYYYEARGYSRGYASFTVNLEQADAEVPEFYVEGSGQSQEVSCSPGEPVSLSVTAHSTGELTYSWQDEYGNDLGSNTDTLEYSPTRNGDIYVYVSDENGNSGSVVFSIRVENNLRAYPEGNDPDAAYAEVPAAPHDKALLRVAVDADDPEGLTYQWYDLVGDEIPDAEGAEYETPEITDRDTYYCTVKDKYGNEARVQFNIYVETHFSVKPIGAGEGDEYQDTYAYVYVSPNEKATLQVEAASDYPESITYQWYFDGNSIEGATGASYVTGPVTGSGTYRCEVEDGYGANSTIDFYVSVQNNLDAQPVVEGGTEDDEYWDAEVYLYVRPNEERTLSVDVSADDLTGITYEWYDLSTGEVIEGAAGSSYSTGPITDGRDYYCVVRDQYGNSRYVYFYINVRNDFRAYAVVDGEDRDYDVDLSVPYNESASLQVQVEANDKSKVTYSWSVDGEQIDDAAADSYTTDPVTTAQDYECYVTDGYGNGSYINFRVHVENHLSVRIVGEEDTDVSIPASPNAEVTLQVEVSADDDSQLAYRWIDTDTDEEITDAEGTSYTIQSVEERKQYKFEVTDQYNNYASAYFNVYVENHLTVYPKENPGNDYYYYYAEPNQPAVLEVIAQADDTEGLTYEWYNDGAWEKLEENGAAFTTPAVTSSMTYQCTVRDTYGNYETVWFYVRPDNQLRVTPEGPAGIRPDDGGISFEVDPGETVTLHVNVTAKDMDGVTYRWTRSDGENGSTDIEGVTGDTCEVTINKATHINCYVTDKYGNQDEAWFSIRVRNNLRAWPEGEDEDSSYKSVAAAPHEPVTMKVMTSATDVSQLTYMWEKGTSKYYVDDYYYYTDYELIESPAAQTDTYTIESATENASYRCTVSDQYDNSATVEFDVKVDNKLEVHPKGTDNSSIDVALMPGEETDLTTVAEALDTEGITYKWYKDGEILEDRTDAVLPGINKTGSYNCEVQDTYGNTDSAWFHVTVNNNLKVRQEGNSGIYNGTRTIYTEPGQDVTLNVAATATVTDGLAFTWYSDGSVIDGANSVSYVASGNRSATYKCEVTDQYGSYGAVTFHVIVNNRLTAYAEDAGELKTRVDYSRETMAGRTLRVIASAADTDSIHYQWRVDNDDDLYDSLPGENTDTYTVTQADLDRGIVHACCDVTDDYGNSCSVDYYFYRNAGSEEESFSVHPDGAELNEDEGYRNYVYIYTSAGQETVTLKVIAEGTDAKGLHYEWRDQDTYDDLSFDQDTIEVPNQNSEYRCIVTNENGVSRYAYFYVYSHWLNAYVDGGKEGSTTVTLSPSQAYTLKVAAEGSDTDNLTYTWYRDDSVIAGATAASLDIVAQKGEEYTCEVRDSVGYSDDVYFRIKVGTLTAVSENTEVRLSDEWNTGKEYSLDLAPGGTLELKTKAESSLNSAITYQWFEESWNGDGYSRSKILSTDSTYVLTIDKKRQLTCRVKDEYGNTYSVNYRINVNHFTVNKGQEEVYYNPDTSDGCTLKLSVSGDDLDGVTYRWNSWDDEGEYNTVAEGTDSITVNPGADCNYECYVRDKYGNYRYVDFDVYVKSGLTAAPADTSIGTYNEADNLLTIAGNEGDSVTLRTEASNEGNTGLTYIWRSHSLADPAADMETGWTRIGGNSDSVDITANEDTRFECFVVDRYGMTEAVTYDVFTSDIKVIAKTVITLDHESYTYDGTQKKPGVTVQYQNENLTEGKDYTVTYGANTNAGEGTVTVTGKGDFEGSAVKTFTIEKAGQALVANKEQITLEAGSTDTISVTGAKTAVTFTSSNEDVATVDANGKVTAGSKGTAVIKAEAVETDNYKSDSVSVNITVTPEIVDIARAAITIEDAVYTGSVIAPAITAVYGGETLKKDTDYTLVYGQNTDVGTYTVTINGTGTYKGSVEKTYKIVQAEQVLSADDIALYPYKEAKVSVTGARGALSFKSSKASVATVSEDGTVTAAAQGEATITVTAAATANYKAGSAELTVTVTAYDLASADCEALLDAANIVYDGEEKKPAVTVKFGELTLTEGTDYTVSYKKNVHAGAASATITGNNKVTTGTKPLSFDIQKAAQVISATATELFIVAGKSDKITVDGAKGTVTYASSDTEVVSVDAQGNVTAAEDAADKTATITVNAAATDDYNAAEAITVNVKVVADQAQLDQEAAANAIGIIRAATLADGEGGSSGGSFANAAAAKAAADAAAAAYNALTPEQKTLVKEEIAEPEKEIKDAQAAANAAVAVEAAAGTFGTAAEAKAAADAAAAAYDALTPEQKALLAKTATAQNAETSIANAQAAADAAVAVEAAAGTFGTAAEAKAAADAAAAAYDALTPEQKALLAKTATAQNAETSIANAQAAANAAVAVEAAAGPFATAAEAQAAADAAAAAYNALTPEQKALVNSMVPSIDNPEKAIEDAQTAAGKQKTAEEEAARKAAEEAAAKKAAEEAAARKAAEEAAAKKAAEEAAAKKAAKEEAARKAAAAAADKAAYGPAKGKTIKKSNFKYKVTKQGKRAVNGAAAIQGTVTITGFVKASKKKTATSVSIPATIKVDGITYKVTAVGAKAFKSMAKLKKVTVGANVTKIDKNAFQSSKKLKTVTFKTKVLKSIGANAFKGIQAKASFKLSAKVTKKAKIALIKKYKRFLKKGKAPSGVTLK